MFKEDGDFLLNGGSLNNKNTSRVNHSNSSST
jgi:hypothetical protein